MGYVRARVSDESYEGWVAFCRLHGISVSALVEAIGPLMREWADAGTMTPYGERVVTRARAIDEERRRRR